MQPTTDARSLARQFVSCELVVSSRLPPPVPSFLEEKFEPPSWGTNGSFVPGGVVFVERHEAPFFGILLDFSADVSHLSVLLRVSWESSKVLVAISVVL